MDITIPHGDARAYALQITAKDPVTGVAAPLDLTGKALRFQVRRAFTDATALIEKLTGSGITHAADQPGVGKGKATLTLIPTDTSSLPNRQQVLWWEVQVEDGANIYTAIRGRFAIEPEVVIVAAP